MVTLKPLAHQVEGIDFLRANPRAALYDEPGLGKSMQLLGAAKEPALIVAPAMILDSGVWDDEIERWASGIEATQVSYSSLCVRNPRGKINRDANGFPIVEVKPEYRKQWGSITLDESHYVKSRKTSWTAGVQELQKYSDTLKLATGTPIPNWAHEAFTQLQLIYPEKAVPGGDLGSYWRWAREWFMVGATMWAPIAVGGFREDRSWAEFNEANWGDRMKLRLRKDCLDLPPLTLTPWRVKMTKEQRRVYKSLKRDYIAWLDSGQEIAAWNSGSLLVKLAMCATGLEILDPEATGSGKLDALQTILDDRPRPTLIVAHFRDTITACARVAENLGKSVRIVRGGVSPKLRREAIRAFQSGSLDVLVASIATISEGLTLHQGGADQVIRVERSARPSWNEQVLRRLHRMGVERPIQAIDLITEDSVDESLLELLQSKTDHQMQALGLAELRALV